MILNLTSKALKDFDYLLLVAPTYSSEQIHHLVSFVNHVLSTTTGASLYLPDDIKALPIAWEDRWNLFAAAELSDPRIKDSFTQMLLHAEEEFELVGAIGFDVDYGYFNATQQLTVYCPYSKGWAELKSTLSTQEEEAVMEDKLTVNRVGLQNFKVFYRLMDQPYRKRDFLKFSHTDLSVSLRLDLLYDVFSWNTGLPAYLRKYLKADKVDEVHTSFSNTGEISVSVYCPCPPEEQDRIQYILDSLGKNWSPKDWDPPSKWVDYYGFKSQFHVESPFTLFTYNYHLHSKTREKGELTFHQIEVHVQGEDILGATLLLIPSHKYFEWSSDYVAYDIPLTELFKYDASCPEESDFCLEPKEDSEGCIYYVLSEKSKKLKVDSDSIIVSCSDGFGVPGTYETVKLDVFYKGIEED